MPREIRVSGHPLGVYATRQDPAQVLEDMKRAAVEQLGRVPDGLYEALDSAARDTLAAASPMARRDHENAMMVLRQRNATYVMRFRELVAEGFDHFRALPAGARRPATQLDLVEESQLQYHVAGQRLADAIALRHAPALQLLESRLEALSTALGQASATNPIGPVRLAGAFGQTFRDTLLPDALRPLLFAQYEQRLGQVLGDLYGRINTILAVAGYGSPTEVQRARQELPPAAPRDADTAEAANDAPAADPAGEGRARIDELRRLLRASRQRAGYGDGGGSAGTWGTGGGGTGGTGGMGTGGGAGSDPRRELRPAEVISVASLLQSEPPEAYAKALAGEARLADAIRLELADGARRLGLDPKRTRLGEGEQDAIELVGLLFESLFQTHAMLQRSRRLYARLVLPYVKVALMDEDVFVQREHPARRLLDAVTEACEGNDGATPQDRELLKHAASAAHRVVADFNEDLAVFDLAASELEALLQQQRQRVDAIERRAAEAVHGRERLLQARLQASAAVARRLAQVPVTAIVGNFLVDYWQHHVLQTLLRDGLDSQRHRDALALGEAMVEADRVAAMGHGPAVADLLISLQPDISECLSSSGLDDAAARDWMAGLARALARPDTARSLHELPEPPHAEEEGGGLQLVGGTDALDFDPAVAGRMRRLKPGDWVRLGDQDSEPVAAKVAWISPLTARYLLVNRRGGRVLVASAEQLAALVREGRLEVDTEQAPFDAAMQQLRHRLDQAVGQD
ncbi:MAG TPA: DUF1631 family protein [Xanthomonadaceae bacterium]|nr:DUF1631 family protein [Xanthomonadaceae bacterium]